MSATVVGADKQLKQKVVVADSPLSAQEQKYEDAVEMSDSLGLILEGSHLLVHHGSAMGSAACFEVWERLLVASAQLGQRQLMLKALKVLSSEFPDSQRVDRLATHLQDKPTSRLALLSNLGGCDLIPGGSMALERKTTADETAEELRAIETASFLLENKPDNLLHRLRFIDVLASRGKYARCISLLDENLKEFCCDVESWRRLGNWCLNLSRPEEARFCFEEILVLTPQSTSASLKLGDIFSANEEFVLAIKMFSLVLATQPDCLHAMWGVIMCQQNFESVVRSRKAQNSNSNSSALAYLEETAVPLAKKCCAKLIEIYSDSFDYLSAEAESGGSLNSIFLLAQVNMLKAMMMMV